MTLDASIQEFVNVLVLQALFSVSVAVLCSYNPNAHQRLVNGSYEFDWALTSIFCVSMRNFTCSLNSVIMRETIFFFYTIGSQTACEGFCGPARGTRGALRASHLLVATTLKCA